MDFPITGRCQCGSVHYELNQAPKKVVACHCRQCQIMSSAPFSVTAMVDANAITFYGKTEIVSRIAESGNTNSGAFCPSCGVRIYQFDPASPSLIKLKLKPTSHQYDELFAPQAHIWVKEKQSWLTLPSDVPSFDTTPN